MEPGGVKPILVTGATGYVGARLVSRLRAMGFPVRAAGRSVSKLRLRPFAADDGVELAEADVHDAESLRRACSGCEAAYYLVHSMVPGQHDFSSADRDGAGNMARAAESAGLSRIIYLGGLVEPGGGMSEHLRSRAEVGEILASGPVPVTTLRAAMVIGAGSGSFEILRYLVDRLPLMVTPRWVGTESQPIAIKNVLDYLAGCLEVPETSGETYDIGGPDIVTYRQLMRLYAEEADLPKRRIVPVPVLTPRLSSYWIHLITPVPAILARPLAEGLSSRLVCRDNRIRERIPVDLLDCRGAVREALRSGRWEYGAPEESAGAERFPEAGTLPGDPAWAGGTVYTDHHAIALEASPEEVWDSVARIGGSRGWYYADRLWSLRGLLDRMAGGPGLRKGRRDERELAPGDPLDFWRVAAVEPNRRLLLVAEMKLPGCATLEFRIHRDRDGATRLHQISTFAPRGLAGVLYWKGVGPFHHRIFTGMLKGIARSTGRRILAGPEHLPPTGSASDSS
ncbi:MAG TPA: DUF2867 domain-containing protein [Deltaproteobacteria bacterium]|nr:DUF2867 domain-containing protein [Deltaproteobacteria bacterium]